MPRSKSSSNSNKKKNKIMKAAKGFKGGRSKLYRTAKDSVTKALQHGYVGRKLRKREFRALWIARINVSVRPLGLTYNKFINGLKKANIEINRKMLSELAINDMPVFEKLVEKAKEALAN